MFVIIQCWNNLPAHERNGRTLPEKIALTMQHAGVAITVTSVTDVFAFGVGSVTVSATRRSRVSAVKLDFDNMIVKLVEEVQDRVTVIIIMPCTARDIKAVFHETFLYSIQ